jgi:hypothetical protein
MEIIPLIKIALLRNRPCYQKMGQMTVPQISASDNKGP